MRTNRKFLRSLSTSVARFYLADLHVHSPGSADIRIGERFEALSAAEKKFLPKLKKLPDDLSKYDVEICSEFPVSDFYNQLVERRDRVAKDQGIPSGMDRAFVGITDHNVSDYAASLSQFAWDRRQSDRLIVLPGIELDVSFDVTDSTENPCNIHMLCLFSPCTKSSDIRLAITTASNTSWDFGGPLKVADLPEFVSKIRGHEKYPGMCIAAHVWSSKGIQKEASLDLLNSLDAEIARIEGELAEGCNIDKTELKATLGVLKEGQVDKSDVRQKVLKLIGSCGFDALQVRGQHEETYYRRLHRFRPEQGRAIPICCSDAHSVGAVFSSGETTPHIKVSGISHATPESQIFEEIRERGLRYGETRTCFTNPGSVATWIEGIEIVPDSEDAATFWPFEKSVDKQGKEEKSFSLSLSRNLNCLIGGRGSGKSAALEAIGFVTGNEGSLRKDDACYQRARATLSGCTIRVCWKSTGIESFEQLKKKSMFVSRYFDPNDQHGTLSVTDLDGKEVLDHSAPVPKLHFFRIHEIEEAAAPEKLRELFDQICGVKIGTLNGGITEIKHELSEQRIKLVDIAKEINNLLGEASPLREYAKRKQQFQEVDRPEVKKAYLAIDSAGSAELLSKEAVDEWSAQIESLSLIEARASIESYFREFEAKLKNADGDPKGNCELIVELILPNSGSASGLDFRKQVVDSLESAEKVMNTFEQRLSEMHSKVSKQHTLAREELTSQGFPTGGKDREAKKKAFEQAKRALDEYKELQLQWEVLVGARNASYKSLDEKCIQRTKLRRTTAEKLTEDLARDLDSSVLIIEADAQPMAERKELSDWLQANLWPKGRQNREERLKCLVEEKQLQPSDLREILLLSSDSNGALLVVDKPSVREGQITEDFARSMCEECFGRKRLTPEMVEEEAQVDFWTELPDEIKNGLLSFPTSDVDDSLNVDKVLELDEIVFDDVPIVRLNDRPLDSQSVPRPLSELSPGQRCSAILPILLLTGDGPLVIDQPEDNLDNRLIRQVIVNILASIKLRRQVIVATHNPNLPVLGDAEQAIVLRASGERECKLEASGNLDSSKVVRYVTDIMEGGREAFQYRQTVYEPHWRDQIVDIGN